MQTQPEAGGLTAATALLINRRVHVIYFSLITAVNPSPADRLPTASLTASPLINVPSERKKMSRRVYYLQRHFGAIIGGKFAPELLRLLLLHRS